MRHRQPARALAFVLAALAASALVPPAASASEARVAALLERADGRTQLLWARRYQHAEGVTRDYDVAVRLLCAAAREGHVDAQYELGWTYANARGVARDETLAGHWFRLAAEQGHRHAARMAARLGAASPVDAPACVLVDGSEILGPLRSEPDPSRDTIEAWVARLAPDYDLDPALVLAVIQAESAFEVRALSHKGAQGLMQLIPATAERFGVEDVWDPLENIRGGMAYLRWLLDFFDGDRKLALAGYNAGERAVRRYGGVPPYPETRTYVRRVTRTIERAAVRAGAS